MFRVFYHRADLDGKCSAAIVAKWLHDSGRVMPVEFIGVDYKDDFDSYVDRVASEDIVFIVDFSFTRGDEHHWMEKILDTAKKVYWFDHHATAIEHYNQMNRLWPQHRIRLVDGVAGCEITWQELFSGPVPRAVNLLGRYDVWDHKDPDVLPFQYGMRSYSWTRDPEAPEWGPYLTSVSTVVTSADFDALRNMVEAVENTLRVGIPVMRYQDQHDAINARSAAFEAAIPTPDGLRLVAICLNEQVATSRSVEPAYRPERHDVMVVFSFRKTAWKVSLYSDKPDVHCGEVAKSFGGGGHKGAAGFFVPSLPAWLIAGMEISARSSAT